MKPSSLKLPEIRGAASATLRRCRFSATLSATVLAVALFGVAHPSYANEPSPTDAPSPATASDPVTPVNQGLSIAALGGFGTNAGIDLGVDTDGSSSGPPPDAFGPALGLRAAYAFQPGFVAGASLVHHFGGSPYRELTSAMVEAGWAFPVGPLALEPFAGFGWSSLWVTSEICNTATGDCSSSVTSNPGAAVSVGFVASIPLTDRFFLGARAQAFGMVAPEIGFTGFATAGVRL